jgi:hypothetical protein
MQNPFSLKGRPLGLPKTDYGNLNDTKSDSQLAQTFKKLL